MPVLNGRDLTLGRDVIFNGGKSFRYKGIGADTLSGSRVSSVIWNGNHFPPPPADCVLYLPGYPAQSDTIKDYSGQDNNGTITGATWVRLPSGLWVLSFDGTDDRIEVARDSSIEPAEFTLETWIRFNDLTSAAQTFFSKDYTSQAQPYYSYHLRTDNNTAFRFLWNDGSVVQAIGAGGDTIPEDTWLYVVATYKSGEQVIYLNGVSRDTGTRTDTIAYFATDLLLGEARNIAVNDLNGFMALQRIHNRAFSAAEPLSNYNQKRHLFGV